MGHMMAGVCTSSMSFKLTDDSYLKLVCTKQANHDADHQAVYYWQREIEDFAIPGITEAEAEGFHAAIKDET